MSRTSCVFLRSSHSFRSLRELTPSKYRGRLAPSPTGLLHVGHARTFWIAQERARAEKGVLILRNEDLDRSRARPEFVQAFLEDLKWFGFSWTEGPDGGGPFGPYDQSERIEIYRQHFEQLRERGFLFPCTCSRQDVLRALQAPHAGDEEPLYPGTCRGKECAELPPNTRVSWRFRVPDGEVISFNDGHYGPQRFVGGKDFGDFVVWRHDGVPSYQLACVVDDHWMGITEVVRGEDLLMSAARQLLLYRAFGWPAPDFYHCELMRDDQGQRLAKRHDSVSLRALRESGLAPEQIRARWDSSF
ncbi:MAG TPA: tRNA glutamyl-Q(34) synthetase GluQRS [Verrucomicrobiae bacterium]